MPSQDLHWSGTEWVLYGLRARTLALVGDSTMNQSGAGEARYRALLPNWDQDKVWFYARDGKPIILNDDQGFNVVNNVTQATTALGAAPDMWVVNLGSNGHRDARNADWINTALDAFGDSKVLWVGISQATGYDAGESTEATRMAWNATAQPLVEARPNGRWLDWHGHIKSLPGGDASLWNADGVHMTTAGYTVKNAFVAQNINESRG